MKRYAYLLTMLLLAGIFLISSGAPVFAQEKTTLRLYGLGAASYPRVMTHALGEIVNKNSDKLRIEVLEGMSSSSNLFVLQKDKERRADTLIFTNTFSNGDAQAGRKPFKAPYTGARLIATFTGSTIGLYTSNPEIKTIEDMKGKSAHFAPRGATPGVVFSKMLQIVGILDQVKVSYGGFEAMTDAMINGTVDVGIASAPGYIGIGMTPAPNYVEPYSSRKLTFVSFTKEQLAKTQKALNYNVLPFAVIPAKTMFPNQAAYPVFLHDQGWWADASLDEKTAYELAKTIVTNLSKFGTYHKLGTFMRLENIAWIPLPADMVHPGAARYYRENNIPMGDQAKGMF
ncbi:MAG: TAXI family TRAP transporter solute-binding subunit [Desulfobacterales bacterium]|nr:TAXI family TRAP transporter solute-binding subunit [Desulfobacterales bacterium]